MTLFPRLSTLADTDTRKRVTQKWVTPTIDKVKRKRARTDADKLADWRDQLWEREKGLDRMTGEIVFRLDVDDPNPHRGECAHTVPRRNKATRYDPRAGCLLGVVNHRKLDAHQLRIVAKRGSRYFTVGTEKYLDMNFPVRFEDVS